MKFFDVVLISFAAGFLVIGVHQSIVSGFGNSYWIFMLTLVFLLWFKSRNNFKNEAIPSQDKKTLKKGSRKKVKSK